MQTGGMVFFDSGRKNARRAALPEGPVWRGLWVASTGAVVFYVLMEWVFVATKPSFMSILPFGERARILFLSPLPLVVASGVAFGALRLAARALPQTRGWLVRAGLLWPGLILASSFLLLLDNFTYTLFRVGVQTAAGFWKYGYLLIFLWFWRCGFRLAEGWLRGLLRWRAPARTMGGIMAALLAAAGVALATGRDPGRVRMEPAGPAAAGGTYKPNILLLTPDGISAEHMSAYGYERETTPFIRSFGEGRALFCENGFPNANTSGGSLASLLTGKLPTAVKVFYPPEILTGRNAYEHLPGLLRQFGYKNVDIGARQFADAYDLNLLNAFDEANGRKESRNVGQGPIGTWLGMNTGYFLGYTWERLRDRALHFSGFKDFESTYELVAGENLAGVAVQDRQRLDRFFRLLREGRGAPWFVHIHLLVTHGPNFRIQNPVFSKGQQQAEPFERDFYDDALLEFDGIFRQIVEALQAAGTLDDTIVVLTSDHGKKWSTGRIPLMMWFPHGAHARRVATNAQNVDIAPTLLHYLGRPKPEWMAGLSLLDGDPPAERPVFCTFPNNGVVDPEDGLVDFRKSKPPFHSLGGVHVTLANRRYAFNLITGEFATNAVVGHTGPMDSTSDIALPEAREILVRHLEATGYDVPASRAALAGAGRQP